MSDITGNEKIKDNRRMQRKRSKRMKIELNEKDGYWTIVNSLGNVQATYDTKWEAEIDLRLDYK